MLLLVVLCSHLRATALNWIADGKSLSSPGCPPATNHSPFSTPATAPYRGVGLGRKKREKKGRRGGDNLEAHRLMEHHEQRQPRLASPVRVACLVHHVTANSMAFPDVHVGNVDLSFCKRAPSSHSTNRRNKRLVGRSFAVPSAKGNDTVSVCRSSGKAHAMWQWCSLTAISGFCKNGGRWWYRRNCSTRRLLKRRKDRHGRSCCLRACELSA